MMRLSRPTTNSLRSCAVSASTGLVRERAHTDIRVLQPRRGFALWRLQMKAMLLKRAIYMVRNW